MALFDLIFGIAELISLWRLFLSVFTTVPIASWLHNRFGDAPWVFFISVLLVAVGLGGGFWWQWQSGNRYPK